ncbi:hypothetical protein LG329_19520 (plasmid) [Virgibacillus necropolis]|uniref:hypothetical protein n=1 Tax=Virgibacillus necropolis TaxID=163877 RepID=UPI003850D315
MKRQLNLLSVVLLFLLAIGSVIFINFYTEYDDLKLQNEELTKEIEGLKKTASIEQQVYTKTEEFLSAIMEGGAEHLLTERYKKEVKGLDHGVSEQRASLEEMDIYNISVRKQKDGKYLVYATYKASLGGIDVEVDPSDYTVYILMSKITFMKEDGELKVDRHDLRPFEKTQKFFKELQN